MTEKNASTGKDLFLAALVVALLLWATDSILDFLWFNTEGVGFISILLPLHDPNEMLMRILSTSVLLLCGGVASGMYRKRAESEKRAREERNKLSITLNSIGDAVIAADAEGRITRMNPIAEKLTGWTMERARGAALPEVFKIIDAHTRDACKNPVQKVIRTGKIISLSHNTVLVARDGAERQIADSAAPIRDEEGNVVGVALVFREVTEEYRLQEALRHSEEKYRTLIESMQDGVFIIQDSAMIFANDAFAGMAGYTVDDVLRMKFTDLITPEDREMVAENYRRRQAGKPVPASYQLRMLHKDGSRVRASMTVGLIHLDGRVASMGTVKDITEEKRTKEALEKRIVALTRPLEDGAITFEEMFNLEEIQRLQDLFARAAGVASIITGPDGTPITEPSNFTHLCSNIIRKTEKGLKNCYKSDAALGRPNPDGPIVQTCLSGGLWDAGASISVGGRHIANWLIGQVRDETQTEEKMLAYAREIGADESEFLKAFHQLPSMSRDRFNSISETLFSISEQLSKTAYQNVQQARFITERKRAEKDLQQARNYISNIIDPMPSLLVGVDMDGKVTQWNLTAARATGIAPDAAVGRTLSDVFPRMASEMEKIAESIRTRETRQERKKPRETENGACFEDVTIYPLIANGVDGAVIRVDDVTEKVRMEEMMIQSEKMLSVGGLAAGMAHEINNPLAGILQNVQVMKIRVSRGLPKNQRVAEACETSIDAIESYMEKRGVLKMIESVSASGRRAAKIVNNMLSFSRKSESSFAPRNVYALLDQTIELAENDYDLKKKYDFRKIAIIREYDPAVPETPCEGSKIQQVFLNILKNGAQAMCEADTPAPRFICRILQEGEMIRIEIEDNGPGMDPATRKRVFEPFFTTKDVKTGTGLGLSVSYFIITENHGGTMTAESEHGRGTRFIIRLPMEREM
ncbi:MAG: PAS domain S-box protein [Desulfobacterales bacterium]|nr:PAS domain S-box protein [Desulfobacterales bacterium]